MRSEYKVEDIIEELTKLSGYVKILQSPDEYFIHMQGHRTELSLALSAFSIAEMSKDIINLLNKQIPKKPMLMQYADVEYMCEDCGKKYWQKGSVKYCIDCGQKFDWND